MSERDVVWCRACRCAHEVGNHAAIRKERLATLPLWASNQIEKLTRDVAYWRARAKEATAGSAGNGRVMVQEMGDAGAVYRGLPDDAHLRFVLSKGPRAQEIDVRLTLPREEEEEGGQLLYLCSPTGSLVVEPRSANSVLVGERR